MLAVLQVGSVVSAGDREALRGVACGFAEVAADRAHPAQDRREGRGNRFSQGRVGKEAAEERVVRLTGTMDARKGRIDLLKRSSLQARLGLEFVVYCSNITNLFRNAAWSRAWSPPVS